MNKEQFLQYAQDHLISSHQAREITEQSLSAFKQSVRTGKLRPALEIKESESRVIRLFFRDDVVAYKTQMSAWQASRKRSE
ncbi:MULTISPECIES: hypothetical protein [Listeria]|uniref:hypothetical protein n=1 Tax=Listeria TaxID=1637 RepID=UPI000B596F80|nr:MULTISPECIES: hypothetical protein [Listeria]